MNKTPVSILQEIMVKKGTIPNYELIHDGGGTHINTFTYRVTCDGLSAIGTGRCKKDAKHEAANAMLTAIAAHRNYPQLPASPAESPVRTPLPDPLPASPRVPANVPFVNAIGALQDLCTENSLQEPEYLPINDVGPPHAKVFTIRCIVSNFIEDGVGTTKKQAKHEAAKKMTDRINELLIGIDDVCLNKKSGIENDSNIETANEIAKKQYSTLSKVTTKKINLGVKLTDYHNVLKHSMDVNLRCKKLEELHDLVLKFSQPITSELLIEIQSKLEALLLELNITYTVNEVKLEPKEPDVCFMEVHLDMYPPFTQIGMGKTETDALFKALSQMINTLQIFWS